MNEFDVYVTTADEVGTPSFANAVVYPVKAKLATTAARKAVEIFLREKAPRGWKRLQVEVRR